MAERSEKRRQVAVALAVIVAAAATIATSPVRNSVNLNPSTAATVVLDAGVPRATTRFVLDVSPEALPVATGTTGTPTGTVTFSVRSTSVGGEADGPLELKVSAAGLPEGSQDQAPGWSWSIEQLCIAARPCHWAFDVAVEWLQPRPGGSVTAEVQAFVNLTYSGRLELPTGATVAWEPGEFVAVAPAPALTANVDLGRITLGRDAPWAARHILLRGSAVVVDNPAVDVSSFLSWDPSGDNPPPVTVAIHPDDPSDQGSLDPGSIMAPFAGCLPSTECVRGFTIVARWAQLGPDEQVTLDWSYGAVARFRESTSVPSGATFTVEVDNALDLGPASPRIRGQANGSFDLQSDGSNRIKRITLQVTGPELSDAFSDETPPAVGILRLWAVVKDRGTPAQLIAAGSFRYAQEGLSIPDDGTEARAVVFPLDSCRVRCTGTTFLFVQSLTDRDATINWDLTIDLPVPLAAQAVGTFQVEVADAP